MKKQQRVKLNLGCGSNLLLGFINVDNFVTHKAPNFRKADVRSLPFSSNYADYVLMDNVLEHIPMADILIVLTEIRRVLKVGGRCVIMVPDFSCIARHWLEMAKSEIFNPYIYQFVAETIYGTQLSEGEFHKTAMSPTYLNYALCTVGFRKFALITHPAGGPLPSYPGMTGPVKGHVIRNDQLVADITKT